MGSKTLNHVPFWISWELDEEKKKKKKKLIHSTDPSTHSFKIPATESSLITLEFSLSNPLHFPSIRVTIRIGKEKKRKKKLI